MTKKIIMKFVLHFCIIIRRGSYHTPFLHKLVIQNEISLFWWTLFFYSHLNYSAISCTEYDELIVELEVYWNGWARMNFCIHVYGEKLILNKNNSCSQWLKLEMYVKGWEKNIYYRRNVLVFVKVGYELHILYF